MEYFTTLVGVMYKPISLDRVFFEKLIVFYHVRKSHIIEPEGQEHFHRACYMTLPCSVFCVLVNYSLSCKTYNYIMLCVGTTTLSSGLLA
jgi:hypothetical protein